MNTSRFENLPITGRRYRPPFARTTVGPAIARNENVQTDIQRGIIHQVAPNATSPTTCSVLLNGTLVPKSGFSLEPGVGPFYQSGTHPSGPFYNDPATNTGGTLVEVNTRAMTAKLLQGTGTFIPDSSAWAIVGAHVHTGGTDPTTGNPLPGLVDINGNTSGQLSLARLAANPSPSTAPVLASTGTLTYISPSGSGSYDAAKPFTLSFPTGYAGWLADIRLFAQPAQSGHVYNTALAIPKGALPVVASGVYTGLFGGLAAHQAYDLFVAYLDGARGLSTPVWVDTTSANPMVVGQGKQAAMPGTPQNPGGTLPTPNIAIETAVYNAAPFNGAPRVYGVNSSTVDFSLPFYADDIGTTDTLWLGEIQLIASITTLGKWQQVGLVAPAASVSSLGHYVGIWAGLGAGNTYDVAVRYIDFAGNTSNILSLGTYSVPAAVVTSAQLPSMPNGTTVSASTTLPIPAVNYNSAGSQPSVTVPISLTISDSQWLTWLNTISILVKQMPTGTTSTDGDTNATNFLRVLNVPAASYVSNPLIVQIPLGASVNAYEISVQLLDKSGLHECHSAPFAITSPQLLNGPSTIAGLDNSNLVSDSDMSAVNGTAGPTTYGASTYWTYAAHSSFGVLTPGAGNGTANILAVSTGASTFASIAAYSEPINVVPGQLYCATVSWATTNVVSGQFMMGLVSVADKTALNGNPTTQYAAKVLLVGSSGSASGTSSLTYQVPASGGPTQVVLCLWAINVKANFYWAKPQVEAGGVYSGYKSGPNLLVTGNSSYGSSSTQSQAVIKSDGTADPSKLNPVYGLAPHAVMPTVVQNRVSSTGTLDVSSTPGSVTGNLPLTNLNQSIQNRNGIHWSVAGQMPYITSSNVITFPSVIICFRQDGTWTRIAAGTTLALGGSATFGAVFVPWQNNGLVGNGYTPQPIYIPFTATGSAGTGYQNTVNSSLYEVVGGVTGDSYPCSFAPNFDNTNLASASANVITDNSDGTGYLNVDRAHPSKQLPYASNNTAIKNAVGVQVTVQGQPPYLNGTTLTFPNHAYFYRADNTFCQITAGTTLNCSGNSGYGTAYLVWSNNAAGSLVWVGQGATGAYEQSSSYERVGTGTPGNFSMVVGNSGTDAAAYDVITDNGNGTGTLNIDTKVGVKILPRGNHHGDFTSTIASGGGLTTSAQISKNGVYNSVAYTTDMVLHVGADVTTGAMSIYIDNGTSGTAPSVWLPSAPGSPTVLAVLASVGSPISLGSPLNSTTNTDKIYCMCSYKPGTTSGVTNVYSANVLQSSTANSTGWTVYAQKNANYTAALAAALYADAYAMSFTPASGGLFNGGTGAGNQTKGGSGGGRFAF